MHGHVDVDDGVAIFDGPVNVGHDAVILWHVSQRKCCRSTGTYHPRVVWVDGVIDRIRDSQKLRPTVVSILFEPK